MMAYHLLTLEMESKILALLREGHSNREIERRCGVSRETVRARRELHRGKLWQKKRETVARERKKALNDAPILVVIWLHPSGEKIGMASYGRTKALCEQAGKLGDYLLDAAMKWGS